MFKRKKNKTPKFRKPTVPPQPSVPPMPPTSGSNAFKPNPNYVPPAAVKKPCPYETPCGWCTKWDKECDRKMYTRSYRIKHPKPIKPLDESLIINKTCQSEEDHEWECCGMSTGGSHYSCKKCGAYKTVPYTSSTSNGYQGG